MRIGKIIGHLIESRASSASWYWRARWHMRRVSFYLARMLFRARTWLKEAISRVRVFRLLTRLGLMEMLGYSVLAVLIFLASIWASGVSLPSGNEILIEFSKFITGEAPRSQASAYQGFLIAVITLLGLFLTLYFTNISTVAGSMYARLNNRLRSLFIRERVANVYVGLMIFILLFSIVTLILTLGTNARPYAPLVLIVVLSLLAIANFRQVSQRAFDFFDPTYMARELIWQFHQSVDYAKAGSFKSLDGSFQEYFRKRAEQAINGLLTLASLANEEENLKIEPRNRLLEEMSLLLRSYIYKKSSVPLSSKWFPQQPKFKKWYLASSYEVELAQTSQTDLRPDMEPRPYWVEDRLLNSLFDGLESQLEDNDVEEAIGNLQNVHAVFESLVAGWQAPYACDQLPVLETTIFAWLPPIEMENRRITESRTRIQQKIGMAEAASIIPISMMLAHWENLQAFDLAETSSKLKNMDWTDDSAIYKLDLPSSALRELEALQRQIRFEITVDGDETTPAWYVKQVVGSRILEQAIFEFERLLETGIEFYRGRTNSLDLEKLPYTLMVASRGLEFGQKATSTLQELETLSEDLESWMVEQSDLWPSSNWSEKWSTLDTFIERMHDVFASSIPNLAQTPPWEGVPDFLGRAVHVTGEELFRAMSHADSDRVKKLFAVYFFGSLKMYETIREHTDDWEPRSSLLTFSQPLLDLVSLSGYALLFSELHGDEEIWKITKETWQRYFADDPANEKLELLANVINYTTPQIPIPQRQLLRTNWEMKVSAILDEQDRRPASFEGMIPPAHFEGRIDHDSPVVRAVGGPDSMIATIPYDGIDIFVQLYLMDLEGAEGLDFGRRTSLRDVYLQEIEDGDPNSDLEL